MSLARHTPQMAGPPLLCLEYGPEDQPAECRPSTFLSKHVLDDSIDSVTQRLSDSVTRDSVTQWQAAFALPGPKTSRSDGASQTVGPAVYQSRAAWWQMDAQRLAVRELRVYINEEGSRVCGHFTCLS